MLLLFFCSSDSTSDLTVVGLAFLIELRLQGFGQNDNHDYFINIEIAIINYDFSLLHFLFKKKQ